MFHTVGERRDTNNSLDVYINGEVFPLFLASFSKQTAHIKTVFQSNILGLKLTVTLEHRPKDTVKHIE